MQMSRRSALGLLLASVTKLPLEIDAVSQFLKPKANESEIAEWLLKMYRAAFNLEGIESELDKTWSDLGLGWLDFAFISADAELEFGVHEATFFDTYRMQTGRDIVTAFTYLQESPDIPLGIFEAESHLDVQGLIQANCRKAIHVIAADPDEQLTLMGNVYCPGCNLTSYYAEWLRRAIAHPRMHRVEGIGRVRDLVQAIDRIPKDERACTFEGKAERLYLKGWEGARDAAREAIGVF